jgi:hypothetical protein
MLINEFHQDLVRRSSSAGTLPVDVNRARTTQPHAASDFRASQASKSRNVHSNGISPGISRLWGFPFAVSMITASSLIHWNRSH